VTVGKRATLWIQDLMLDQDDLDHILGSFRLLGARARPARRPASLACLAATMRKSKNWTAGWRPGWALPPSFR
jgi:adenylosuccinate lyase